MKKNLVIGITGLNGAGKGTVVEYLVKDKGFWHYSASGLITEEIERRGGLVDRDAMIRMGNELRVKYGAGYLAEELLRRAIEKGGRAIIESIRTVGEVESLRKMSGDFVLLAVEVDQEIRYKRIRERGSAKDNVSFDEFKTQEEKESFSEDKNKQNLVIVGKMADFRINNDGDRDELKEKINYFLEEIDGR